jgi:resuscitation-promoting factor RpfA
MNDKTRNSSGNDGEFERDLAATSRAYKSADADTPPPAMDDAIRAAARRAVKSQPRAIGKSWVSRWSAPISAAALVVLTVSVTLVSIQEQPENVPAPLKDAIKPKVMAPAPVPIAPVVAEPSASAAAVAPPSPQAASALEKKSRTDRQSAAPQEALAESARLEPERRRAVSGGVATESTLARAKRDSDATGSADVVAASPAVASATPARPAAKEAQSFVSDPPISNVGAVQEIVGRSSVDSAKREAAHDKQMMPKLAASAGALRNETLAAAHKSVALPPAAPPAPVVASTGTIASPAFTPATRLQQSLADKLTEVPEAWMKRILELKQQGKTREFGEELAKFRKRYPDFALPEELKTPR